MAQENPTGDAGVSTLERLESFLTVEETPQQDATNPEPEQVEDEPKADAQDEPSDSESADEPEQASETPNEYQLSDLAKLLGAEESAFDVDDDGSVTVKTKVDGQEGRAKFVDLLKSYQLQSHVDKQVREAAEQRKALQEQSQALQQQMQIQSAMVEKVAEVKSIEAELAQYEKIDWNALTDQDPVQALKLDRQMRELQQKHFAKRQEVEGAYREMQSKQAQTQAAMLENEHQALVKALPEWADGEKSSAEKKAIASDLKARGYSDAEIKNLADHRTVLLARDAMLYRQQQAAKTVTEKQVRAAPRIAKPGTSQTGDRNAQTIQNLKTAVRKSSGSRESVMDYLLATGKV